MGDRRVHETLRDLRGVLVRVALRGQLIVIEDVLALDTA